MLRLALVIVSLLAPAFAVAADFPADDRRAAVERIADLIDKNYVYADKAAAIAAEMRGWTEDPAILRAPDRLAFASLLTERLTMHDSHFNVRWSDPADRGATASGPPRNFEQMMAQMRRDNYGFDAVERLDGNIGYLRMSFFAPFDQEAKETPAARRVAEAAMAFIQGTEAVIIDLRQNGGGAPGMVHLIFSHFLGAEPLLINKFYNRQTDQTIEFYSFDEIANERRPTVPLYVLISGRTGSAAEEFAYDVQTHGRGLIVGERSGGAANPGQLFDAGDGFSVFVSTGAAVNPVTGVNWEGVGVKPDVEAPADMAFSVAYDLALAGVLDEEGAHPALRREAQWTRDRLKAERASVQLPSREARGYAGKYGDREISYEDGALVYRRARRPPVKLLPLGDDEFAAAGTGRMRVRFGRDARNRVTSLILLYADGEMTAHERT